MIASCGITITNNDDDAAAAIGSSDGAGGGDSGGDSGDGDSGGDATEIETIMTRTLPVYAMLSNAHLLNSTKCTKELMNLRDAIDRRTLWSLKGCVHVLSTSSGVFVCCISCQGRLKEDGYLKLTRFGSFCLSHLRILL
ncbi:hypothetical protein HZH68_011688 [Vespula germanica]|uniref:Uncharacterized protein n=1 Tax=Vespula germanica TaxID=30212 RepID=A0A834JLR1_VESGE|nr:hypothetical protein HZH68_011688 [Vespula germanica]